jgi:hypothetical protein
MNHRWFLIYLCFLLGCRYCATFQSEYNVTFIFKNLSVIKQIIKPHVMKLSPLFYPFFCLNLQKFSSTLFSNTSILQNETKWSKQWLEDTHQILKSGTNGTTPGISVCVVWFRSLNVIRKIFLTSRHRTSRTLDDSDIFLIIDNVPWWTELTR